MTFWGLCACSSFMVHFFMFLILASFLWGNLNLRINKVSYSYSLACLGKLGLFKGELVIVKYPLVYGLQVWCSCLPFGLLFQILGGGIRNFAPLPYVILSPSTFSFFQTHFLPCFLQGPIHHLYFCHEPLLHFYFWLPFCPTSQDHIYLE